MESANAYLMLSLQQDLDELNRICQEITENSFTTNTFSWLLPTKRLGTVLGITTTDSMLYVRYLELIIDRLYFILTYFNESLNKTYASANQQLTKLKNVSNVQLTLGRITWQVFKKISTFQKLENISNTSLSSQNSAQQLNRTNAGSIQHKETQTDQQSANGCNSCNLSMICIKNLLKSIENVDGSLVAKTREEIRNDLYEMTQVGCMNKLTSAIDCVITTLCNDLAALKRGLENCKLDLEKEKLTSEIYTTKSERLENDLNITQEKLSNRDNDLDNLQQFQQQQIQTIQFLKKDLLNIQKQASDNYEKYKTAERENETFCAKLYHSVAKCDILNSELGLWKRKFEDISTKQHNIEIKTERLIHRTDSMQNEIDDIVKNVCSLLTKCDTTPSSGNDKEAKENSVKQCIKNVPEDHNQDKYLPRMTIQVEGDPVKDMKKQVDVNTNLINQLEIKNSTLVKIIRKLESIKL